MGRTVPWHKIRSDGNCHYCGEVLTIYNRTRDHVVPKALGGTNCLLNLLIVCFACNQRKGDQMRWCACFTCMAAHAYHAALMAERFIDLD